MAASTPQTGLSAILRDVSIIPDDVGTGGVHLLRILWVRLNSLAGLLRWQLCLAASYVSSRYLIVLMSMRWRPAVSLIAGRWLVSLSVVCVGRLRSDLVHLISMAGMSFRRLLNVRRLMLVLRVLCNRRLSLYTGWGLET